MVCRGSQKQLSLNILGKLPVLKFTLQYKEPVEIILFNVFVVHDLPVPLHIDGNAFRQHVTAKHEIVFSNEDLGDEGYMLPVGKGKAGEGYCDHQFWQ